MVGERCGMLISKYEVLIFSYRNENKKLMKTKRYQYEMETQLQWIISRK